LQGFFQSFCFFFEERFREVKNEKGAALCRSSFGIGKGMPNFP